MTLPAVSGAVGFLERCNDLLAGLRRFDLTQHGPRTRQVGGRSLRLCSSGTDIDAGLFGTLDGSIEAVQLPGEPDYVPADVQVKEPHPPMRPVFPVGVPVRLDHSPHRRGSLDLSLGRLEDGDAVVRKGNPLPGAYALLAFEVLDDLLESLDPICDLLQHPLLDPVQIGWIWGIGLLSGQRRPGTRHHQQAGQHGKADGSHPHLCSPFTDRSAGCPYSRREMSGRGKRCVRSLCVKIRQIALPGIVAVVTDSEPPTIHDPGGKPWRLGLLSLVAVAVVAGGVLILSTVIGDDGADTDPTSAASGFGITIPPLPATARGEGAAPDFSLDLFDGTRFSLGGHIENDGRPLILNLWASWCPPCRDEMPDLEAAALANPGVVILGVAVDDDPTAAEEFAAEIAITYPAGYDDVGRVSRAYPTNGLPATFVISADGMLLKTAFGRLTVADIDDLIALALAGSEAGS